MEADFPTLCMTMTRFLRLELMLPHEEVVEKLIEPADDAIVHFVSHEWLGFDHPDPAGTQLRCMQTIFTNFLEGKAKSLFKEADWEAFLKGVSAGTSQALRESEAHMAGRERRTAHDLMNHVKAGCVWLDYHSIPQACKDEIFIKAVQGIPSYVERSDYFWICAPPGVHADLQEPRNYSTWRSRGWCRLEETTNFLSRRLTMPLVVTDQPYLSTFGFLDGLHAYYGRPERSVFNGCFTCCQRDHQLQEKDGSFVTIPCDKDAIAPVLRQMFENFLAVPSAVHKFRANAARNVAQVIFAGYPSEYEKWQPNPNETLEQCLARLEFTSVDGVDSLGWGPMLWFAQLADMKLVRELAHLRPNSLTDRPSHGLTVLTRSAHLPHGRYRELLSLYPEDIRESFVNIASDSGYTAVDRAAKYGFVENLRLLIETKAQIEVRRQDSGASPLLSAASSKYPRCVQVLLEARADINARDLQGRSALHLAADPLCVIGNTDENVVLEVLEILLEARANVHQGDNLHRTPLDVAVELKMSKAGRDLLKAAAAKTAAPEQAT